MPETPTLPYPTPTARRIPLLPAAACAALLPGCLLETSFPVETAALRLLESPEAVGVSGPPTVRNWAPAAHTALADLLPSADRGAVTGRELCPPPESVYERFGLRAECLASPFANFGGILHTAQVAKGDTTGERDAGAEPRPWPGFESVWVPGEGRTRLYGRLGLQRDAEGRPVRADAVVIAVGFLGNLHGYRYRDLSEALFAHGYHVLMLEMRGHGRTGALHPDIPMTFGILEALDLLSASAWVRERADVGRVGLIGFSWGATDALIAAWLDGDPTVRNSADAIRRRVPPPGARSAFDAGVVALSPIVDMPDITESFEAPAGMFADPIRNFIQKSLQAYQRRRGAATADHRVRSFIRFEAERSDLTPGYRTVDRMLEAGFDFLDVRSDAGLAKLARIRTPVLVVHGANDPLSPAHLIAELGLRVRNPDFSVLILPGSGHGGVPAVSSSYYYSLLLNFFSATAGPKPCQGLRSGTEAGRAGRPGRAARPSREPDRSNRSDTERSGEERSGAERSPADRSAGRGARSSVRS